MCWHGVTCATLIVVEGISLAISEPGAGSDVANIQTSAEDKGDHWLVNGSKKWITGGNMADFFTCAVRTGKKGMVRNRYLSTFFSLSLSLSLNFADPKRAH